MLFNQHALLKRLFSIVFQHRHHRLRHDRTVIQRGGDEMYGRSMHLDSGRQRLPMRCHAWKTRQQRRMDIEHASSIMLDACCRQNTHESGQHNQIRRKTINHGAQRSVELFAIRIVFISHDSRCNSMAGGKLQTFSVGAVANHGGDAGGPLFGLGSAQNSFHVAATTGDQDNNASHGAHCTRCNAIFE